MIRNILFLHFLLLVYSTGGIFSKWGAGEVFFSPAFWVCYGGLLLVLFGYALGWQIVITRLPLSLAYAHKAVSVIWGVVWGCVIFGEQLTINKAVGMLLIVAGIVVFSRERQES